MRQNSSCLNCFINYEVNFTKNINITNIFKVIKYNQRVIIYYLSELIHNYLTWKKLLKYKNSDGNTNRSSFLILLTEFNKIILNRAPRDSFVTVVVVNHFIQSFFKPVSVIKFIA